MKSSNKIDFLLKKTNFLYQKWTVLIPKYKSSDIKKYGINSKTAPHVSTAIDVANDVFPILWMERDTE